MSMVMNTAISSFLTAKESITIRRSMKMTMRVHLRRKATIRARMTMKMLMMKRRRPPTKMKASRTRWKSSWTKTAIYASMRSISTYSSPSRSFTSPKWMPKWMV